VAHSVLHARRSREVGRVYVSTDSAAIAEAARRHGAEIVERPPELASDTATSESALLHVLDRRRALGLRDPALVVFLQCTSPVRRPNDIDAAIERLRREGADTLFSACRNDRLIWAVEDGAPVSLTYDFHHRQREQEMAPQYRENGSIYVIKPSVLRETGNRLGGKIAIYEMDYWSSFQIDHPDHLALIQWIMTRPPHRPEIAWPERIDLVVFDFDGVMTDNTVEVAEGGGEWVRCHRGDGLGIDRLRLAGVPMMVLSTERHPVVAARSAKLRLECHHGIGDKAAFLAAHLASRGIDPARVAYLGNDENDLGCLGMVGLPVVVADAYPRAKAAARLVLARAGGAGAVREFADLFLEHYHGRAS
jgi:N-acylneuraminate cytidylyltransferase